MSKRLQLIFIIAAFVLVGGYFSAHSYVEQEMQGVLARWLDENELEDRMSWESSSISLFDQSLTLTGVTLELDGADPLSAREVVISDYLENAERLRSRVRISGLIQQGAELEEINQILRDQAAQLNLSEAQTLQIAPVDLLVVSDQNDVTGEALSEFSLTMPGVISADVHLSMTDLYDLRAQSKRLNAQLMAKTTPEELSAEDIQQVLDVLLKGSLDAFSLRLEDQGLLPFALTARRGNNGFSEEQFTQWIKNSRSGCQFVLYSLPETLAPTCDLVEPLLRGQLRELTLAASPQQPVKLAELFEVTSNPALVTVFDQLNLSITGQ
ncbi:hypothetical protein [Pseudomonas sp.]|uniref:hypothetical protein n=1 Tax=Pseudomonas sp. TaxID=306 RepID=UPI0019DEC985|nr:hypothetical protein [Pseudomonas sp.]MBF0674580.1 hypothetical protein [Pseudomonas sp.]MBF0675928.1 hypothetical protein [Pseudomonas sp.]